MLKKVEDQKMKLKRQSQGDQREKDANLKREAEKIKKFEQKDHDRLVLKMQSENDEKLIEGKNAVKKEI